MPQTSTFSRNVPSTVAHTMTGALAHTLPISYSYFGNMILTLQRQRRLWFVALLLFFGAQSVLGTTQDGQVFASPDKSIPAHDRPCADPGRSVDLMDEAQEEDGSLAGPDDRERPPLPNAAGFRWFHSLLPGLVEPLSVPFRPPRLFQ
jgi:hypothetical protein